MRRAILAAGTLVLASACPLSAYGQASPPGTPTPTPTSSAPGPSTGSLVKAVKRFAARKGSAHVEGAATVQLGTTTATVGVLFDLSQRHKRSRTVQTTAIPDPQPGVPATDRTVSVAIGKRSATRDNGGAWACATGANDYRLLPLPYHYHVSTPTVADTLNGVPTWRVSLIGSVSASDTTPESAVIEVAQSNDRPIRLVATITDDPATTLSGTALSIIATFNFSKWGEAVHVKLPARCAR